METMLAMCLTLVSFGQAESAAGSTHRIIAEDSIIGFITYKAGFAAGLVDNNLAYPTKYTTHFVRGATPDAVEFSIRIESSGLAVNEYGVQQRWYPRLHELKILETPYRKNSESRRNRIRKTILSDRMLDAAKHPYIEAKTLHVTKEAHDATGTVYRVGLEITIRGKSSKVEWPLTIEDDGHTLTVETHGVLKLSAFGINPFSTAFGAVRYRDEFHVYARLVASPVAAPPVIPTAALRRP
jgi:hypothetical protein